MHPAEIARIVDRALAAVQAAGGPVARWCACHGVREGGCPGTSRTPGEPAAAATAAQVAALIDHTRLTADATRAQIEALCAEAVAHRFAAICVNPVWVAACGPLLAVSAIPVCAVVGFPLGASTSVTKAHEARRAIGDGAREIDMVLQIGALKSGLLREVAADIEAVVAPCRELGARSKVIIEAALLTDEEKVAACALAQLAGADFVKTSTGFGPGGATAADVALMRRVVGPVMGVKASGGVRTLAALRAMVAAGATRVGTSAGVAILREVSESRTE